MNRNKLHDVWLYMLAYILLLVTLAVCVVAVLEFRSTVNVLWVVTRHSRYTLGLVDQLALLLGGLAAFIYTVFLEAYYRGGVAQRRPEPARAAPLKPRGRAARWLADAGLDVLLRRFAWTVAIPAVLLIASLALRPLAFGLVR